MSDEPANAPRLSRNDRSSRPAAPIRQVHLGLGAFFRAHQAWYTDRAPDHAEWGIAAFTGRSARLARQLTAQQCLYTLVVRGAEADELAVVSSVSRACAASDHAAWRRLVAAPQTSVLSLTVTEAAYCRGQSGGLDLADPAIRADLAAWRAGHPERARTVPGRLAAGLAARRAAGAGLLTMLSCDNLPGNSTVALRSVVEFAAAADARLADWLTDNVRAVDTLVDRITPATTAADIAEVRERTGRQDRAPVVTEPYSEWVLGDAFVAGRPDWAAAGALLTADIRPYERRKLWLLNGAHSLLAYAAPGRGHSTVADAVRDPVVARWLDQWWDEAAGHVGLPPGLIDTYRGTLLERFGNRRIRHQLAQIAADGSQKLPVRVLPVLRAERAAGRMPPGTARILGAWVAHLRGPGDPVDPGVRDVLARIRSDRPADATRRALTILDPHLADDAELVAVVAAVASEFSRPHPSAR